MAHAAFSRMTDRMFVHLGADCVLRGGSLDEVTTTGIIDHDVEIIGESGEMAVRRDVLTIPSSVSAKIGDTLTVGLQDYVIDGKLQDDGLTTKFVLR